MAEERASRLVYAGAESGVFFHGVPTRDLGPDDIDRLSDEEYANITGGKYPAYKVPKGETEQGPSPSPAKGDRKS